MIPLRTQALTVGYDGRGDARREVLAGVDVSLSAGELACLVGPNGSGKSTLLRTIAGMQPPLAGQALLCGDDVRRLRPDERARRLAVVLTDELDVGLMTAGDLVALGRYPHTGWSGRLSPADWDSVAWALRATGAQALTGRPVAELSDGERQRVLMARALAQQPRVLALDEAIAYIDIPHRVELVQILRNLARECGLAVVLTTHDLDLAIRHADTLWLLEPAADDGGGEPSGSSRLRAGGPEDLVLSGAVARAFRSDEVTFDVGRGVFVPTPPVLATVAVCGDGVAAAWTRRAMEREGLAVVDGASVRVDVGEGVWTVSSPGGERRHPTIRDVVVDVRSRLPDSARQDASVGGGAEGRDGLLRGDRDQRGAVQASPAVDAQRGAGDERGGV